MKDIEDIVGEANFIGAEDARKLYPCPSQVNNKIKGVIRPASAEEIQKIVSLSIKHNMFLYPISTGKNWGYGGGVPLKHDSYILDLSHMNNILGFDEELGIVTIEPGVTQNQLFKFIEKKNYNYFVPVTGSSPDCSLIGNALERGYGVTPYTDHFQGITSTKAILADGSIYSGLLSEAGHPKNDSLQKWGAGPYIEGLFSQGNFGIVTQATISLSPKTKKRIALFFEPLDEKSLKNIISISNKIMNKYQGNVASVKFFNQAFNVSMNSSYPIEQINDNSLTLDDWINNEAGKLKIPDWIGSIFIFGTPSIAKAIRKEIKAEIKPFCKMFLSFDELNTKALCLILKAVPNIKQGKSLITKAENICALIDFQSGKPSERFLRTAYWRTGGWNKYQSPYDPGKQECGLIWFAPMLPFKASDIIKAEKLAKEILSSYGFAPLVSMATISNNAISCLLPIMFDPKTEVEAAHRCHEELFKEFKLHGYLPYRAHVNSMNWYTEDAPSTDYFNTVDKLKNKTDENRILSPGRYDNRSQTNK